CSHEKAAVLQVSADSKSSRMTFTWLCLLFAAPLLLSAASSDDVSVKCNDTEAVFGQSATIHCTYTLPRGRFRQYHWNDTRGDIKCNSDSGKHTCESDSVTRHLSMTISDVRKEENYTVNIQTDHGTAKSPHIKLQIISPKSLEFIKTTPAPIKTHGPVILGIVVPVIALVLFGALFGKKIINHINKETPKDNDRDMELAVRHDNKELQELVLKPRMCVRPERMETLGWSCVLGILCLPAEVLLHTWTVSQEPSSTSIKTVNSSAEISCSTSLSDPISLTLQRKFHSKTSVSFLYFIKGTIRKITMTEELKKRIRVSERKQLDGGVGVSFKIDLMQLQDTNLYFCTWSFVSEDIRPVHLSTNGTIIIVREELCGNPILDLVLIAFSVTAFTVIVLLFTGAMILRHRRFKKRFTPGRAAGPPGPPRPPRPQHTCPQHQPYLVTSLDFRGTL
ncbi:hypothetical protein NQZ68_011090, partial [Dissostichus eleginoides]